MECVTEQRWSLHKDPRCLTFTSFCGNILRSPGLEQAICSNQTIARESTPVICSGMRHKDCQETRKALYGTKRMASGGLCL